MPGHTAREELPQPDRTLSTLSLTLPSLASAARRNHGANITFRMMKLISKTGTGGHSTQSNCGMGVIRFSLFLSSRCLSNSARRHKVAGIFFYVAMMYMTLPLKKLFLT